MKKLLSILLLFTTVAYAESDVERAAAPRTATYVTLSADNRLVNERVLTEGLAIDFTDAGAGSTVTAAFDPTELTGSRTFGDASTDTIVWTFNRATGTDGTITSLDSGFGFQRVRVGTAINPDATHPLTIGNATSNTYFNVGQSGTNNSEIGWSYNATPALAFAQWVTYGYSNPIKIDASIVQLQTVNTGGSVVVGSDALFLNGTAGWPLGEINFSANTSGIGIALEDTWYQVGNFANSIQGNMVTATAANDELVVTEPGDFISQFCGTLWAADAADPVIDAQLKTNNGVTDLSIPQTITLSGSDNIPFCVHGTPTLTDNASVEVWVRNTNSAEDVVMKSGVLTAHQEGG